MVAERDRARGEKEEAKERGGEPRKEKEEVLLTVHSK
jgi:hypothetical protein